MRKIQHQVLILLLCAIGFSAFSCKAVSASTKVALVIGNSKYESVPLLTNPTNDADDVAQSLKSTAFDVIEVKDATRDAMVQALRVFVDRIRNADVALFYYAGHAVQVSGENYLIPIDAKIEGENDVRFNTIDLGNVQQAMNGSGRANIIILDACRNNPFADALANGARGVTTRGLQRIDASGIGSLVVFATQPNNVSLDGTGRNSPFTSALLKHVGTPGLEVRQMISRVRGDVLQATDQKQVPWDNSSLVGDVYLAGEPQHDTETVIGRSSPGPTEPAPRSTAALTVPAPTTPDTPAAQCERLAAPAPAFATPAQVRSAKTVDWAAALPICQSEVAADPANPKLQFFLGRSYDFSKNYVEAAYHYSLAVNSDYAPAEDALGALYVAGHGVIKSNIRAVELFEKAAAAGVPNAMGNLGAMYANGWGVKEDDAKALALHEKAIEAGNYFGLAHAGVMYYNGKGTERDYAAAAQYFQQAADLGDGYSLKFLAIMTERGLLGKPDPGKAAELRLRAAEVDPNSIDPIVPLPRAVNRVTRTRVHSVVIRRYRFLGCTWAWC